MKRIIAAKGADVFVAGGGNQSLIGEEAGIGRVAAELESGAGQRMRSLVLRESVPSANLGSCTW